MSSVEIVTIIIISIYLTSMLVYFVIKKINGESLLSSECNQCKNRGKRLIKYYYKQKKKEEKLAKRN